MIESMVAITLVLVGLLGIFGLITKSISINNDVRNRFTATYLAAEGLEVVKNIIDTDVAIGQQTGTPTYWNSTIVPGSYEVQYDTDRDTLNLSWTGGAPSTRPLLLDTTTGLYSYNLGVPSIFTRTVTITGSGGGANVESIVKWKDEGVEHQVHFSDTFTNWRG